VSPEPVTATSARAGNASVSATDGGAYSTSTAVLS
jgi:hypothetical protein